MKSIAIITLNWNRPADTIAFLDSAFQQTLKDIHLIVVDNGSTDQSVEQIRAHFPQVEILVNPENLGFAKGMNTGIRYALEQGMEYIFIANNDTLLAPDMLERLVKQAQTGQARVIAPVIFYASDPKCIWSAGAGRNHLTLEVSNDQRGETIANLKNNPYEVELITACGMLVHHSCFETVGLFDERFFMYYEDSDFSLRVRKAGLHILVDPQAQMWHKVATSSGGSDSPSERYWMARSSLIYFRKHARPFQWLIIGPFRLGSALKTTSRLLLSGNVAAVRAYWRGLRDGLLN